MTAETRRKVLESIASCNRYIAKEAPRSADLRPADIQQLLDWYYAHRAKLIAMLEDCEDCQKAARLAYSDATTPGFMHSKCEKHRAA